MPGLDGRAERILRHHDQLIKRRAPWESHWQEVAEFVFPRGADFNREWTQGQKRTHRQYDAFGGAALNRFASALESGLVPRQSIWARLTTGDDHLDETPEIKRYLEELNRLMFHMRYAPAANFASQLNECFYSLGAFGTSVMYVFEREDGGTGYRAVHLGDVYIAENQHGIIDVVHRVIEPTTRQAVQRFGDDTPPRIRAAYDRGDYEDTHKIIHCVKPSEDYNSDYLDNRQFPVAEAWVYEPDELVVREGGFYEMPYLVSRYVTSPRETYGRSPAMMVLPDIKSANEVRRITLDAAALAIDPPWLLPHDNVLGDFSAEHGARNYGGVDEQGNQLVVPMITGAKPEIGEAMLADLHNTIDDAFLGIYFRVLLEHPQMTATQAMLIAQQQGQMAQPMIGRQQTEFLGPMIKRESGVLHRQGRAPEPPEELVEYLLEEQESLSVKYESPMVLAARQEEGIAILRTIEQLAPLVANLPPEEGSKVYRRFNKDKTVERLSMLNGVPMDVLYTDEELEEMDEAEQQQRQAAEAAQLALQAAPVAADAAKTMAETQAIQGNLPPTVPSLPARVT